MQIFRGEDKTFRFSVIDATIQTKIRDGGDGIDEVQTTISVVSTAGFAAGTARAKINDEIFSYTGLTSTSFTGVSRGAAQAFGAVFGAQPHSEGSIVSQVPDVALWTTSLDIRETRGAAATIIGDKVGSTPSGPVGLVDMAFAKADTDTLPPDKYVFGLTRTDANSNTVLAYGSFTLDQEVTR